MDESPRKIIGLVMVRNEDCYIAQVLKNIALFCDKIIITDHHSDDDTPAIIREFCHRNNHTEFHTIKHLRDSHTLIESYAGGNYWVFAVDGDEIYDPDGLKRFKEALLSGVYDNWWVIFGNVLNCVDINFETQVAAGHLAPPCRSMTKPYNFSLIDSWKGSSGERLHGGTIAFKEGYGLDLRYNICDEVDWEEADLRCLHMCFLQRSSKQKTWRGQFLPRPNPADIMSRTSSQRLSAFLKKLVNIPNVGKKEWKVEKFTRGEKVQKDISFFFPSEKQLLNE